MASMDKTVLQTIKVGQMLKIIQDSPYQFHLTGSQYFGSATVHSDWDFMVSRNCDVIKWLANNGFRSINAYNYYGFSLKKQGVVAIYRKMIGDTHIDIQLCDKLHLRLAVQEKIVRDYPLFHKIDKEARAEFWRQIIMRSEI